MNKNRHATRIQQQTQASSQLLADRIFQFLRQRKLSVLAMATACFSLIALTAPNSDPSNLPSERSSQSVALNFDAPNSFASKADPVAEQNDKPPSKQPSTTAKASTQETIATKPPETLVKKHTLKPGDNLSSIFQSVGLSARDVHQITQSGEQGRALTRMYPGESLDFIFSDKELKAIVRKKSKLESIHFTPTENGSYSSEVKTRTPETRQTHKSAIVTQSLALAADRSGLSATTTMNMANIFGGVIDFVYDVRAGDRFTVVYEEKYLDDEKIGEGNILAAQYINRGKEFNAYRYEDGNGEVGYYNADGISMRKAFLRAPLDFTRVSSGFNLKRLHPITKKIKPHRGIDYAAPTGTPVFSVGEGRVIASGYSNANGKYVFIKHGEAYTTKYLHLSRRAVKNGQRVKQGQIIGHVGCTGLCTGPHLHYEFLVNGVHRNPRTIINKLPKAKKLDASDIPAFTLATNSSREALNQYSSSFELASNE